MKKRGFTLIELLAVIVVLAIIALIATPIVMNTIKNSKKGAEERGADNYVKQVETSLMEYSMKNNESFPDGEYEIDTETGNLVGNGKTLTVEMSGTKPSNGSIKIENGQVKKENSSMKVGDYDISYDTTNKTFVASEKAGNNVEVLCTKADGVDLTNLTYGNEFTCELGDNDSKTFYVLETINDNVSLIMNMNIDSNGKGTTSGNTVAWSLDGSNVNGPVTALAYLSSSTESWSKLDPSQISLPSGEQIATAGGDTEWTDRHYTRTVLSSWLYGNLSNSSAPYFYWTSTPYASNSGSAWHVSYVGCLSYIYVGDDYDSGVRPVITISKTQLG